MTKPRGCSCLQPSLQTAHHESKSSKSITDEVVGKTSHLISMLLSINSLSKDFLMQFKESNSTSRLRRRKSFPDLLLPKPHPSPHPKAIAFNSLVCFLQCLMFYFQITCLWFFYSAFHFKISIFDFIRWKTRIQFF